MLSSPNRDVGSLIFNGHLCGDLIITTENIG